MISERRSVKHVNPDGVSLLAARLDDVIQGFKKLDRVTLQSPDMYYYASTVLYRDTTIIFAKE